MNLLEGIGSEYRTDALSLLARDFSNESISTPQGGIEMSEDEANLSSKEVCRKALSALTH